MDQQADQDAHSHPSRILEEVCRSKQGYDLCNTRDALTIAVNATFNQNIPCNFQLDVAEALILGLDTTVIAGMGSRKTLPWAMPLLLDENKGHASCQATLPNYYLLLYGAAVARRSRT